MKSLHKLLIVGAAVLVIAAIAVPVLYAQPVMVSCCDWEGTGDDVLICNDNEDTFHLFQHWHAVVVWRSADTTTDTIMGCWYDDDGHGGWIYGYRVHATDSAFGTICANDCTDPYCEDSISIVPEETACCHWAAKWTGCCDEQNPYVDGEWAASGGGCSGSGTFDDSGAPDCNDQAGVCE